MDVTFLGTGGGFGVPNPFSVAPHAQAIRAAGGKSIRRQVAVLINDDLLIDCGPQLYGSIRAMNLHLARLRTLIITHQHSDHFDPWFFWGRRAEAAESPLPLLTVYAPQDVLDEAEAFYRQEIGWDFATFQQRTQTRWHPVQAGMLKLVSRYRLRFFPASHGMSNKIEAVLVGVQDAQAAYFHCYDTGPLHDAAWKLLEKRRFDAVALDSCIGLQEDYATDEHMTFQQTINHAQRMREMGILKPGGLALATHFVTQSALPHEDLVNAYEPQGVQVAYDGLRLTLPHAAANAVEPA